MRPLTDDQRTLTAARLRAIADELTAPHAPQVQALIATEADPTPWPTSTRAAGNSSGPNSPVEAAAAGSAPPNRRLATTLASDLRQLAKLAQHVDIGLQQRSPLRVIARCADCGNPLRPGRRCAECNIRHGTKPVCADCGQPEDRHGLRPYITPDGTALRLCVRDWMWRHRHGGQVRNGTERLTLAVDA